MSRHIPPHRWADAHAGRVTDAERAKMNTHAASCRSCARVRDRVGRASESFPAIREQATPELPWDSVRARVHWSVSKEKRAHGAPPPRRPIPVLWAGALAATLAGGIGVAVVMSGSESAAPAPVAELPRPPTTPPAPVAAPAPAAIAGLVNRTSGEVMVDGVRPTDLFAQRIVAGTVLATGDGRLDVQFGEASAFALGPRSTVELRRFDASTIELAVTGTIDIEVAPRMNGQRFLVIAGDHTVEVRGTQFRVSHEPDATTIACRHGLVAVGDRASNHVEVGAARRVKVATGSAVSADHVVALTVDELSTLSDATPMSLPLADIEALARSSGSLEIATVGRREVRVDGVELGLAPLRVRMMPGRHTVEAADHAGRYRRAGWVDVAAASAKTTPARLAIPADPPPTSGIKERRRQLLTGIDQTRMASCMRPIAKAGLTGTYVQIELAVDGSGAVGFLNVIDTDLPSSVSRCVRDVLAAVPFGKGAAATWREKIDL